MNMKDIMIPFTGYGDFALYQSLSEAKSIIKANGLKYKTEVWSNGELTNPVPWTIIRIEEQINLFFANNKLFKIYIENGCPASLPNGICLGMSMETALTIDPQLEWDDWKEDFQSPSGYWLEDELDNHTVISISIFIKEALDEEQFEKYQW